MAVALRVLGLCLLALLPAARDVGAAPDTDRRFGQDNPTLAYGLSAPHDWSPGLQFLDLMKMARPWSGHAPGRWGGMTTEELQAGGHLDADGWVRRIPPGIERVGAVFGWSDYLPAAPDRKGRYVLRYSGKGEIALGGDAVVLDRQPWRIVFELRTGHTNWWLDILRTDPEGTGDYIRDISVVAEKHLALHEAGAMFNPDWLELIRDARELRFMDWGRNIRSGIVTWSDQPSARGPANANGTALEDMVRLANEVGADPWFTMPHMADADYVRRFAEYVRDALDPRLTVRVEWSNEAWNWQFPATRWALERARAEGWGDAGYRDYTAKKAVETALIWRDVFRDSPGRLRTVLATHTVNDWHSKRLLEAPVWREKEPEAYVNPATAFDELAVTSYFGTQLTSDPVEQAAFLRAIRDPAVDINAYIAGRMRDPAFPGSLPKLVEFLQKQKVIAKENGLALVLYEGGQHVHQFIGKTIQDVEIADEDIALMHRTLIAFCRSEEMGTLYRELWDLWAGLGEGPFMQLNDIGRPGQYGSWGLYGYLGDSTPRSRAVEELAATRAPWWPATPGPQYQHGVIARGTQGDDTLTGSVEEDYLLGGEGNDILIPGPGDDGVNGGPGRDRVVLRGTPDQYRIRPEGAGFRLTGPEGSNFIIHVEEIAFDGGIVLPPDRIAPANGDRTGGPHVSGGPATDR